MPREVTVVTPENIPLTLELAGLGTRFGALLLDLAIQLLLILLLLVLVAVGFATEIIPRTATSAQWAGVLAGTLLFFLLFVAYYAVFEILWNGQTPGKKHFHLRVVRDGGYPINVFAALTRNLVRIADFLPVSYGAGALCVFFHPEYKRLGDLAAGTLVVKEQDVPNLALPETLPNRAPAAGTPGLLPPGVANPADVLSGAELDLLRRFAVRRWEMDSDDSERLAYRLVVPLIGRLNLTFMPGIAPRYADLLSALVAAADAREAERDV